MSDNPFKKLLQKSDQEPPIPEITETSASPIGELSSKPKRGRGRPATGKRSNPGWIGRTYYVREATDIDIEVQLAQLRRDGIELDKSELVDSLLAAWVKFHQGEDANLLLDEISPRRK